MVTRTRGGQNTKAPIRNETEEVLVLDDDGPTKVETSKSDDVTCQDEDVLDGMDLEGVPEQEKEEIKRAILASRQDQCAFSNRTDRRTDLSQRNVREGDTLQATRAGSSGDSELKDDEPARVSRDRGGEQDLPETRNKAGTSTQADMEDEDETQPPSDQEQEESGSLDLTMNTLDTQDTSNEAYHHDTDHDEETIKSQTSQSSEIDLIQSEQPSMEEEAPSPGPSSTDAGSQHQLSKEEEAPSPGPSSTNRGSQGFSPKPYLSHSTENEMSEGPGQFQNMKRAEIEDACVSKDSEKRGSQGSETEKVMPLQRHYRAVKKKVSPDNQYFATEGISEEQCAKAIYQLFETYRRKLKEAQRKLMGRLEWGNPVKSGQHQTKTIDVKRRGQTSMYVELSDDEDFQDEKKPVPLNAKKSSKSDDEFEKKNRYVSNKHGKGDTTEDIMGADTQPYDAVELNKNDNSITGTYIKPSRLRKRSPQILAEDTQDPDVQMKGVSGRGNVEYVVEETQAQETDMDWLSVKRVNHRQNEKFENQMQKAKLKGYTVPRRKTAKEMLIEKHDQKEKEELGQKELPNEYKETESKPAVARGRKRKNRKEAETLAEDTQDMSPVAAGLKSVGSNVRKKRRCFSLSSDSEEESVPETQNLDDSPDVTIIEEDKPSEIAEAAKTYQENVSKIVDNMNKSVNQKMKEEAEDSSSDIECLSPVIKRSRRLQSRSGQTVKKAQEKWLQKTESVEQSVTGSGKKQATDKGVKRLFSRPESKESNASDDVSVASSQISNTFIDESGDLYSTQIFEHNTRNNKKDVNQNVRPKIEKSVMDNNIDEIQSTDSDEDVYIIGEVKQQYSNVKSKPAHATRVSPRIKKGAFSKEHSISQYFVNSDVTLDKPKTTSLIDQDPGANQSKHLIDLDDSKMDQGLSEIGEDHPMEGTANENKMPRRKSSFMHVDELPMNEANIASVPYVCLPDIRDTVTRKERTSESDDEQPISLKDFAAQRQPRYDNTQGARPKTKRQGKPADIGTVEPVAKMVKLEEPTIPCPLCNISFPMTIIEQHAANCDGTVSVEDTENQPPNLNTAGSGVVRERHRVARNQQDDSDEDILSQEQTSIVDVDDPDVQDVMRTVKNNEREEGECLQCYICDRHILKGQVYSQHLSLCMQRAKQQQEEVDTKGYQQAYNPQPEMEEVRHTRGRTRQTGAELPTRPARGLTRGRPTNPVREDKDGYRAGQLETGESSESLGDTDSSSWEDSSSGDNDDDITLGSLARASSSSLVTGPWNSKPVQTQSDGSHSIPDWLKNTANSPIKSFKPLSMQNSEYFNKQFSYNEKRVAERQKKRKREQSRPKRRTKRRKIRRKKKTHRRTVTD